MLHLFIGTDSDALREKLSVTIERVAKKASVLRVTDAHSPDDIDMALRGRGMFDSERAIVLDGVFSSEEMYPRAIGKLEMMRDSKEHYFIVESALDAATKKQIEKYSEKAERFDLVKQKKEETIFALANAMQSGRKKELWVGYQREIVAGKSPENIHGVLFWAAKQYLLRKSGDARARKLVAQLAELPHEARRAGFDLEYALEHFVLSRV